MQKIIGFNRSVPWPVDFRSKILGVEHIINYPDFPKDGVLFKDISPILLNCDLHKELIERMSNSKILESSEAIIATPLDIASKIIQRKKEAGIPITPLPSGSQNLDLIIHFLYN